MHFMLIKSPKYNSTHLNNTHDNDDNADNADNADGDDYDDDGDDTFICCLLSLNQDPLLSLEGSPYFAPRLQSNTPLSTI